MLLAAAPAFAQTPVIEWAPLNLNLAEGLRSKATVYANPAPTKAIRVTLANSSTNAISGTSCGSGADYVVPTRVEIPAGAHEGTVPIQICHDAVIESPEEDFDLALEHISGSSDPYQLGRKTVLIVGITEGTRTVDLSASATTVDAGSAVTVTVTPSGDGPGGTIPLSITRGTAEADDVGANQAFVHQYRFAATENVPRSRVSHAISLLLLVGLVSAFAGPELGRHGRDWIEGAPFAGAFVGLAALHFLSAVLLAGYRDAGPAERTAAGAERPLGRILAQPTYVVAVAAAAMSFAVMTMMMTAAPISMHAMHGFGLDVTAWAIEGHVVAMFLPSVITGTLIARAGVYAIMFAGVTILAAATGVAWLGESAFHYAAGLVLLGWGWNFLFTAGNTLITTTYRHSERFKAQGLNDLLVFGSMALMTLAAGVLLELVGWRGVLLCTLPFLAVMLALLCFLPRPTAEPAGEAG